MRAYLTYRNLDYYAATNQFGWYPATYHGPRIIVPCIRTDEFNFWQGRLIDHLVDTDHAAIGGRPWKRWDSPFGPRGDAIAYLAKPGLGILVVVEGPMDALAAAMTRVSAIATLGAGANGPALAHVALIAQRYKKVILIPDRDETGAWIKIQNSLGMMGIPTEIREPRAKDLADLSVSAREDLLRD